MLLLLLMVVELAMRAIELKREREAGLGWKEREGNMEGNFKK